MDYELLREEEYISRPIREIPHYHVDVEWFSHEYPEEGSLEWFLSQPYTNEKKVHKRWVDEPEYERWTDPTRRYRIRFIEDIDTKCISVEEVERQLQELGLTNGEPCEAVFKWDYELEDYRWMVEPRLN